jgi:hypothetical protein
MYLSHRADDRGCSAVVQAMADRCDKFPSPSPRIGARLLHDDMVSQNLCAPLRVGGASDRLGIEASRYSSLGRLPPRPSRSTDSEGAKNQDALGRRTEHNSSVSREAEGHALATYNRLRHLHDQAYARALGGLAKSAERLERWLFR